MKKTSLLLSAILVASLLRGECQAVLIASDSFAVSAGGNDYVPFDSLLGQNPTVGSVGFVSEWESCCTAALVPITGGLTHYLTPGETFDGRLVSYTSSGTVGAGKARNLSRAIDYTPSDGTYYMSLLINKSDASASRHMFAGLAPLQYAETGIFDVEGTWIGVFEGGIWFFEGPGADLEEVLPSSEMNSNETYFALLQYDYSASGSDTVTTTIYDGSSQEVATRAFTGLDVDDGMGRFSVLTQNFGPNPSVDEWRYGTELSDVMVTTPPLPGDFSGNLSVENTDLTLLLNNWGHAVSPRPEGWFGTPLTPPAVDNDELTALLNNWGQTTDSGAAVPEPTTMLLLTSIAVIGLRVRKLSGSTNP